MKNDKQILITKEDNGFQLLSNNIARNYKLSDGAKALYIYLNSHSESFYISISTIADYLRKSEKTIKRHISELKQSGFLSIERINNTNQYKYILYKSPKNKEYAILTEIEQNGLNLSLYDIKDIYNILNDKQITQDTKNKIKEKLDKIIHANWIN